MIIIEQHVISLASQRHITLFEDAPLLGSNSLGVLIWDVMACYGNDNTSDDGSNNNSNVLIFTWLNDKLFITPVAFIQNIVQPTNSCSWGDVLIVITFWTDLEDVRHLNWHLNVWICPEERIVTVTCGLHLLMKWLND